MALSGIMSSSTLTDDKTLLEEILEAQAEKRAETKALEKKQGEQPVTKQEEAYTITLSQEAKDFIVSS